MKPTIRELAKQTYEIRKGIIDATHAAGSGHPGGSLGSAEIMTYLYFSEMNIDPTRPDWEERDRFVLSKGHCAPGLYSTLAHRGYFPPEDLLTLRKQGSHLQGHPSMTSTPGVDMSTGSLGQGISAACGMAMGLKMTGSGARVFALMGDGELAEGECWEAFLFAAHHKLRNLCVILDINGLQIDGSTKEVLNTDPVDSKMEAFGFRVLTVNGNSLEELATAFAQVREQQQEGPWAIIARTTKGRGVSFMENKASWHGKAPNAEEHAKAIAELDAALAELEGADNMADLKKVATRESYGNALVELGQTEQKLVVLDADLSEATKTGVFRKAFPERHINCGIAECNMMAVAAGLSTTGLIPFASTFAMFAAGRAFEQVRNSIGYPHLNVKIGATHGGISVGEDGASHQCCEDFALMRSIPGMTVICPSDDAEARAAVRAAYEHNGPVYLRFGRLATPVFHGEDYRFEIGKGETLRDGNDIAIIATGLMVYEAIVAAEELQKENISARVINIHTLKPLDEELVLKAARECGRIVTAEEHSVIGGLGDAVCGVTASDCPVPVHKLGVMDTFGHSGPAPALLKEFGLSAENLIAVVKKALGK